jgi:hypothetical protein
MDLSLDVEHCCSVAHCLQSFTAVETMSGSNKFMCEACNGLQEAHRRCRVRRWPRCLLLQLKRFKVIESGGAYYNKKLNARVEFAREMRLSGSAAAEDESDAGSSKASAAACSDTMCVLLCSAPPSLLSLPRSSQTRGGGRYSLIGAVVHSGSGANFGHYVAVANVRARCCRHCRVLNVFRCRQFGAAPRSGSCSTTIMFQPSVRRACQVTSHATSKFHLANSHLPAACNYFEL